MHIHRKIWFALVVVLAVTPALSQQAPATSGLTYSSPLENFSLEGMFPVRELAKIDAGIEMGRSWQQQADELRRASQARDTKTSSALAIKKSEIDTVKTRAKQAKKASDVSERSVTEAQLKTDETTIKVLQSISALNKYEGRFAAAWFEAGKALERLGEVEKTVVQNRRKVLDKLSKDGFDGTKFRNMDPGLAAQHRELTAAYQKFGSSLAKMGNILEEYGGARKKVLEHWQGKN